MAWRGWREGVWREDHEPGKRWDLPETRKRERKPGAWAGQRGAMAVLGNSLCLPLNSSQNHVPWELWGFLQNLHLVLD